ncbi:MAG: glycosyltransferase [Salibacteraceae bacterium]
MVSLNTKEEVHVNVFCQPKGWLKENLKVHYDKIKLPGIRVSTSIRPLAEADAWVALRPSEASDRNDLKKTVICLTHALHKAESYRPGGYRSAVNQAGALILSHPEIRKRLTAAHINLEDKLVMERPMGASIRYQPGSSLPSEFTLGWFGRGIWPNRPEWMVRVCRELSANIGTFKVLLVGSELEQTHKMLEDHDLTVDYLKRKDYSPGAYPEWYQQLNCMVITGVHNTLQVPLFEALASGIPVVGTPVGYAEEFAAQHPQAVQVSDVPDQICQSLIEVYEQRQHLFDERANIAQLMEAWSLDDWMFTTLRMAVRLSGKLGSSMTNSMAFG